MRAHGHLALDQMPDHVELEARTFDLDHCSTHAQEPRRGIERRCGRGVRTGTACRTSRNARCSPRATQAVWYSISATVTGSVLPRPCTTMPSESPTSTLSTPPRRSPARSRRRSRSASSGAGPRGAPAATGKGDGRRAVAGGVRVHGASVAPRCRRSPCRRPARAPGHGRGSSSDGAISASGTSTKARSCMCGCGTRSPGVSIRHRRGAADRGRVRAAPSGGCVPDHGRRRARWRAGRPATAAHRAASPGAPRHSRSRAAR